MFTNTVGGLSCGVIGAQEAATEASNHVVSEAYIANVVEQEFEVGVDDALDIAAVVVQVACTRPVLASVVVRAQSEPVGRGPRLRGTAVVILAHIGALELIGHAVIGLGRKGQPARQRRVVVDDHVGDHAHVLRAKRGNHLAQLRFGAEGRVLVEEVQRVIAHRRAAALAALRQPDKVKILSQLLGLGGVFLPA